MIICIITTLLLSCNDNNKFYQKIKKIRSGAKKEEVINALGVPKDIYRKVYIKDTVIVFDYETSFGASSNKAVIFDKDTVSVIRISMGG